MTAKLTVHNAELKTAAVEIQTITISGKQVTLAVFRQLQEEVLLDDDGALNGVPWGTVNYHPDKCADGPEHIHVVWQKGSELRRSRINHPSAEPRLDGRAIDAFAWAYICKCDGQIRGAFTKFGDVLYFSVDGLPCEARWPAGEARHLHPGHQCPATADLEGIDGDFWDAVEAEKERRARLSETWRALNDLPQLFIAV